MKVGVNHFFINESEKLNLAHVAEFYKVMAIDWVKKYRPIYSVWLGPRPFVTLASPELVHVRNIFHFNFTAIQLIIISQFFFFFFFVDADNIIQF